MFGAIYTAILAPEATAFERWAAEGANLGRNEGTSVGRGLYLGLFLAPAEEFLKNLTGFRADWALPV